MPRGRSPKGEGSARRRPRNRPVSPLDRFHRGAGGSGGDSHSPRSSQEDDGAWVPGAHHAGCAQSYGSPSPVVSDQGRGTPAVADYGVPQDSDGEDSSDGEDAQRSQIPGPASLEVAEFTGASSPSSSGAKHQAKKRLREDKSPNVEMLKGRLLELSETVAAYRVKQGGLVEDVRVRADNITFAFAKFARTDMRSQATCELLTCLIENIPVVFTPYQEQLAQALDGGEEAMPCQPVNVSEFRNARDADPVARAYADRGITKKKLEGWREAISGCQEGAKKRRSGRRASPNAPGGPTMAAAAAAPAPAPAPAPAGSPAPHGKRR